MITLLGLIYTSLYHYEVLAGEPCVRCMDRNQRGVCLSDDSWNPTDAFSPGKRYDCLVFNGDMQCVTRDQDSKVVCNSHKKCGFGLNMFTEGTKCFIDMHDGISAHTTVSPSGDREEQKGDTTCEKCTGTSYSWLCIGMGIAIGIICVVHLVLYKEGHIEWKSKKTRRCRAQPPTDKQSSRTTISKDTAGRAETHSGEESNAADD